MATRRDEIQHDYKNFNYSNSKKTEKSSTAVATVGFIVATLALLYSLIGLDSLSSFFGSLRSINEISFIIILIIVFFILIISILDIKKQIEKNYEQNLKYRKGERAIIFISDWNKLQFELFLEKITLNQQTNESDIYTALSFLEQMAISIECELVDEDVLWQYFKVIVVTVFSRFEDWIEKRRQIRQERRLYESLEKLYHKWR